MEAALFKAGLLFVVIMLCILFPPLLFAVLLAALIGGVGFILAALSR